MKISLVVFFKEFVLVFSSIIADFFVPINPVREDEFLDFSLGFKAPFLS